jgi:hypothetical protein
MTSAVIRFTNIVLSGLAFVCLGFLLLMFMRHGWTVHYLFLLALIGLLAGSFTLPGHIRISLALFLLSLAFSCYLAEVVLALKPVSGQFSFIGTPWLPSSFGENASTVKMQETFARQQHVEFDTRNRLSVIMDLRQRGLDAWPQVGARAVYKEWPIGSSDSAIAIEGVSIMPLGGIADKVIVFCNENGAYTIYTSDEHGFHNPRGLWSSEIAVAAVGDSFVLGACVPSDKNFVALLRERYPKTLNVGRAGNGPLSELASIKEFLSVVTPKLVFWFYFEENDLQEDLRREKKNPILREYLKKDFSQGLIGKQAAIDQALMAHVETVRESQTFFGHVQNVLRQPPNVDMVFEHVERIVKLTSLRETLTSLVRQGSEHPSESVLRERFPTPEEEVRLLQDVLEEAQRSVHSWGGIIVFVYLPQWERYLDVKYANKDRERVLDVARSLKLPIIDMHAVFLSHPDPLSLFPLRWLGHYTEEGHRMVANELIRFSSRHLERTQGASAIQAPLGKVVP